MSSSFQGNEGAAKPGQDAGMKRSVVLDQIRRRLPLKCADVFIRYVLEGKWLQTKTLPELGSREYFDWF
jgi:hypothetical protein